MSRRRGETVTYSTSPRSGVASCAVRWIAWKNDGRWSRFSEEARSLNSFGGVLPDSS